MTAAPPSAYREFKPPEALARSVVCLWTQSIGSAAGPDHVHRVFPDGCVDIVWVGAGAPIVAGPATGPVDVALPAETTLVGARFQPGCARHFIGVPLGDLTDLSPKLEEFWPKDTARISERLQRSDDLGARLQAVSDALLERLTLPARRDAVVEEAVWRLAVRPQGALSTVTRDIGLSERQLRRRFIDAVGYGPKTFQRIMRLQRFLSLGATMPGAELAVALGFCDQAHMCRELASLTGRSPTTLAAQPGSTLDMSEYFSTDFFKI